MADAKIKYRATNQTITISPASLASDTALLAGRESTAIDNTTNLDIDALVAGFITVGTTPTIDTIIEGWVYATYDGGTNYPDTLDGTDSAETLNSAGIKASALARGFVLDVDETTSDQVYYVKPFSIAVLFGGILPIKWGLFVVHNTGVNLKSLAGDHELNYDAIQYQSV